MDKIKLKTTAEITLESGETLKVALKNPEDFLNDVVPEGTQVILITKSMKVAKGEFLFLDADDCGVYIYYRGDNTDKSHVINLDHIMAYSDGR